MIHKSSLSIFSIVVSGLFAPITYAQQTEVIAEQNWGIAAAFRTATIPYTSNNNDQTVGTFVPMMFFDNEHVFIDGMQGGAYLYQQDRWQLNALMRLRFVDIPASAQNTYQGDTVDFGAQLRYRLDETWTLAGELMSDDEFRFHANLTASADYQWGDWQIEPHATIRFKGADFNSEYYAFKSYTGESIDAGVDMSVGVNARYHVYSNLYLLGATSVTRLDNSAYRSTIVNDRFEGELFLGFGFFNDKTKAPKTALSNPRYLRVAHGWATSSNIGEIFSFNREKDPYNNQLTSVFYGHPLTDELFGLPLDIYLTPGLVHHWSSSVQSVSTEYVAAIKAYYTFEWPIQWRFGVAEGLSYIDSLTYIEYEEMKRKGYEPSKLLNYLDFSVDVNVGDLFNQPDYNHVWFGYSLHHRSAIFEKASQFGRIKGGSNYNTLYVQIDF
ncbi:MipA/OmpV family protein [Vibrio sinaloensis]|uniref:MipA/OmpV family protein n=1 Tax=Photobacterium sp. (strain ATCC 43367) TaxID=379097 RepID=UPI00205979D3|nr:MipA/OmpV family protein [Vibrio sinaloensis]UPQ88969.1 MipA/OmpV family protein [Vibrio sinaloensis]